MPQPRAVLVIGQDPATVDFSDPTLPPGMTGEKIRAGLAMASKQLEDQGHRVDLCMTDRGETADAVVTSQLARVPYDVVVIGAGLRTPAPNLRLFETVINAVHRHAPQAAIAFNTRPDDTAEAVDRFLPRA